MGWMIKGRAVDLKFSAWSYQFPIIMNTILYHLVATTGLFELTRININSSMRNEIQAQSSFGWTYLSIPEPLKFGNG